MANDNRSLRWSRVRSIFEGCLDQAPDKVDAYLEEACGDDQELRDSVSALLASDQNETPFLDPPTHGAGVALVADAMGSVAKDRHVGNYRLTRVIGSGGMGTVYHALRADGAYEQEVAIKLIRPGMATEDLLRRFRHERQTLANLNHPHIAKLIDGGADDDGTPYLVIEYIDGEPIVSYCDRNRLSIEARLELMRTVCGAVDYAHRNLVVHRDLKPGNILVTKDGIPKLVDFGISKLLADGDGAASVHTATGDAKRLMTPQYASPEQIRGEPITTVSDVYSLGVVLYELLTGHRPYEIRNGSPAENERLVCESQPHAPSTVVTRAGETTSRAGSTKSLTPQTVSAARSTEPRLLRNRLKGDLDTIVMAAMRKDPARRYSSVERLSDDIARYQKGFPIRARRDSVRYRLNKFASRNKAGVAAGMVMACSVLIGVAGYIAGYYEKTAALREKTVALSEKATALGVAEQEAQKARIEARTADRINSFLREMLSAANPNTIRAANPDRDGRDVTVRELIDLTAKSIDVELADEPEVRAAVHYTLGTTYAGLGIHETARKHLTISLDLRRKLPEASDLVIALTLNSLGDVLHELGALSESEDLLRESLTLYEHATGEDSSETAAVLNNLARLLEDKGSTAKAVQLYRRSLEIHRRELGQEHKSTLSVTNNLAAAYARLGRFGQAEPLYKSAIEISRRLFGEEHANTLSYTSNLAVLLLRQGKEERAEELLLHVLEVSRRVLGPEDPRTLKAMSNPAFLYMRQGRYAEAEPLLQELVTVRTRVLGKRHPQTIRAASSLANLHCKQGRYAEAERLFTQASSLAVDVLGAEHPETLSIRTNLGLLYVELDRLPEAQTVLEQVWAQTKDIHSSEDPAALEAANNLAMLYTQMNRLEEAEALHVETLAAQRLVSGSRHPSTLTTMNNLAVLYIASARYAEAKALLDETLPARRRALGEGHPSTLATMKNLARTYTNLGDLEAALHLLEEVDRLASGRFPQGHWFRGSNLGYLGDVLTRLHRFAEAEQRLEKGREILSAALPPTHRRIRVVERFLADLYVEWGKPEQARRYLKGDAVDDEPGADKSRD